MKIAQCSLFLIFLAFVVPLAAQEQCSLCSGLPCGTACFTSDGMGGEILGYCGQAGTTCISDDPWLCANCTAVCAALGSQCLNTDGTWGTCPAPPVPCAPTLENQFAPGGSGFYISTAPANELLQNNAEGGNISAQSRAGSGLSSYYDSTGYHVFYVGANQHVWQLFWETYQDPGGGLSVNGHINTDVTAKAGSSDLVRTNSPLTSFSIDGTTAHVYYIGSADNHVHELYWSSAGWTYNDVTTKASGTLVASGSGLTSFWDPNGEHVFYLGANQHVYHLFFNFSSGSWVNKDLTSLSGATSLAAAGGALSGFEDSAGEHAVYVGTNQHVYHLFYSFSSGSWVNKDLTSLSGATSLAAAGSALSSFADTGGEHAVYIGTNNHVYQLVYKSSWTNHDLTVQATAPTTAAIGSGLAAVLLSSDSYGPEEAMEYVGTDGHLYWLLYDSSGTGGWIFEDLTHVPADAAAGSALTVLPVGGAS